MELCSLKALIRLSLEYIKIGYTELEALIKAENELKMWENYG